jgi:hypothetical protein
MRFQLVFFVAVAGATLLIGFTATDAGPARKHAGRLRTRASSPTVCGTNAPLSFVGIPGIGDVAGGNQNAVLSGNSNQSCGVSSAIGTGQGDIIDVTAQASFLAGGYENRIGNSPVSTSESSFAFIGAGVFNEVTADGAFVGAGGTKYGSLLPNGSILYGNQVSGIDSFVGAGDLNNVLGAGSFIGAGGYAFAAARNTGAGNQISGTDSFIGAGDQNDVNANEAFVGAGTGNFITNGADNSVIGGGDDNTTGNRFDAIAGGFGNGITGVDSFVGGGEGNDISTVDGNTVETNGASYAVIAGGLSNLVLATGTNGAEFSAIGGGYRNLSTGRYGTIAGGNANIASGFMSTVAGGYHNVAGGELSFAAGNGAHAATNGSFVWADFSSTSATLTATRADQFLARAAGGVTFLSNAAGTTGVTLAPGSGAWGSASDRNLKRDVTPLDDAAVLAKVAALPVAEWSYDSERGVRHVGPMAQDFYAAFKIGEDDRHITAIDEDGVALAAIKGLDAKLERRDAEIADLRRELRALEAAFKISERRR